MSALGQQLARLSDRFYDRMRDPGAVLAARAEPTAQGFGALRGQKYCLLVSFRKSGEPVPTPVWFGLDAEDRLYVRTEADAAKVRRIRADARVRVAPATARGKPTGPLAAGTARVLAPTEKAHAEQALQANYGLGRRLYEGVSGPLGVETAYLEVTAT
jgi:PPOX class probable F420-dependent enzyme